MIVVGIHQLDCNTFRNTSVTVTSQFQIVIQTIVIVTVESHISVGFSGRAT